MDRRAVSPHVEGRSDDEVKSPCDPPKLQKRPAPSCFDANPGASRRPPTVPGGANRLPK